MSSTARELEQARQAAVFASALLAVEEQSEPLLEAELRDVGDALLFRAPGAMPVRRSVCRRSSVADGA